MKKFLFISLIILFCIYYISNPQFVSESCRIGVMLWFEQIFPILFVFTIFTNLLLESGILYNVSQKQLVFIVYFLGCIFGFPIGAKLTADFGSKNLIDKKYYEFLSAVSNHFSLPFIIAYTIINQLNMALCTLKILFCLYAPSAIAMIVFAIIKKDISSVNAACNGHINKKIAPGFKLDTQIIDAGIINGFETMIKLCAYIVLFSVISRIPLQSADCDNMFLYIVFASLEATNGIHNICSLPVTSFLKSSICIGILSFGGLSCILQTRSMFSDQKFKILKYVMFKFILTSASIFSFIFIM